MSNECVKKKVNKHTEKMEQNKKWKNIEFNPY